MRILGTTQASSPSSGPRIAPEALVRQTHPIWLPSRKCSRRSGAEVALAEGRSPAAGTVKAIEGQVEQIE
jgi:hypothetical protein